MKAYEINNPPDAAIKNIVKHLLEQKGFSGVFTLARKNTGEHAYALIADIKQLDSIDPLYPIMPANAGKLVSQITMIESMKKPLAVILRPCELRALYELVKLEQASLDNLLVISFTCGGVFSFSVKNDIEKKLSEYRSKLKTGDPVTGIRETCMMCEKFMPDNADIILGFAGHDIAEKTTFFTKTSEGETALQDIQATASNKNLISPDIELIQRKRNEQRGKIFSGLNTEELGWNGLINLFGRCINCHACSSVCPICYCKLCYIDSTEKDTSALSWERDLSQKGSIRVPSDTVMYHLVRLLHVSIMCVGCGMCSDVCPTSIPIGSIFAKVGEHVQDDMNYEPGKDLEEKMPLAEVNPEDFVETGTTREKD